MEIMRKLNKTLIPSTQTNNAAIRAYGTYSKYSSAFITNISLQGDNSWNVKEANTISSTVIENVVPIRIEKYSLIWSAQDPETPSPAYLKHFFWVLRKAKTEKEKAEPNIPTVFFREREPDILGQKTL